MKRILFLLIVGFSTPIWASSIRADLASAINKQVKSELDAAYTYLAMANHAEALSFSGIAHFFTVHFYEEINHAREMTQFLHDQDAAVTLYELGAPAVPKSKATTVLLDMFQASLQHENEQTERIHRIMKLSRESSHYAVEVFFSEFVEEQVEEQALFTSLVDRFQVAGENPAALLDLDRELGKRPMPKIKP